MVQSLALTGATGFVGSHLLRGLLKRRLQVSCLLRTPDKLLLNQGMEKLLADITCLEMLSKLEGKLRGCDTFIHLAAEINTKNIKQLYNVNVQGTLNLFKLAERAGIRRFIFISSANTHSNFKPSELPAREEMDPRPFMDYGKSKLEAEVELSALAKSSPMDLVILKPVQIYGPGNDDYIGSMVESFLQNKGLRGMPFMSSLIKTNPIFIEDVIEAIFISSDYPGRFKGERFFLAGPEITTSYRIAKEIANSLRENGLNLKIKLTEMMRVYAKDVVFLLKGKIRHWAYSGEKARKVLGFTPKVGIRQGMSRTVKWILNEKKNFINQSA